MPKKTIYTLTQEGKDYFLRLMEQHAANPGPMFCKFNIFIKNLSLVDKESSLAMLNSLKRYFHETPRPTWKTTRRP
jgi:DNA-binding PadR family transcriptional regulator